MSSSGPAVYVVVVSWNTAALLDRCLTALAPDVSSGLATVVVVDNGSADGSPALVTERHPWASLVAAGGNVGYGPAVNLGARTASVPPPPWLVAANADVAVERGALAALVAIGEAHAAVGVVAPRLLLDDGSTQHHVHPFPSLRAVAAVHVPGAADRLRGGALLEGRWDPDVAREVDWTHGALLLVRRSAFDAVGGFSADQWLYAEDLDLCWRLRRAGWRTRYVPGARVLHAVSAATTQAWSDDATREDRKQAAAYRWMRAAYGPRRTAIIAAAAGLGALAQAAREPAGWRRDRALAHVARHRRGLRRPAEPGRS